MHRGRERASLAIALLSEISPPALATCCTSGGGERKRLGTESIFSLLSQSVDATRFAVLLQPVRFNLSSLVLSFPSCFRVLLSRVRERKPCIKTGWHDPRVSRYD